MDASQKLWDETYKSQKIQSVDYGSNVSISTAVTDDGRLYGKLIATVSSKYGDGSVLIDLSSQEMRALALILQEQANRLDEELSPLAEKKTGNTVPQLKVAR